VNIKLHFPLKIKSKHFLIVLLNEIAPYFSAFFRNFSNHFGQFFIDKKELFITFCYIFSIPLLIYAKNQ